MSKVDVHKKICEELNALYARKNADYGDSFGKSFTEYGLTMACIRLEDKLNRIKALRNKDAQVADESITDTLMDLANYSIMTLVEMRHPVKLFVDAMTDAASKLTEKHCAEYSHVIRLQADEKEIDRESPKKGDHDPVCTHTCQCMTCARDNTHSSEEACCYQHIGLNCGVKNCPDYVPEEG